MHNRKKVAFFWSHKTHSFFNDRPTKPPEILASPVSVISWNICIHSSLFQIKQHACLTSTSILNCRNVSKESYSLGIRDFVLTLLIIQPCPLALARTKLQWIPSSFSLAIKLSLRVHFHPVLEQAKNFDVPLYLNSD